MHKMSALINIIIHKFKLIIALRIKFSLYKKKIDQIQLKKNLILIFKNNLLNNLVKLLKNTLKSMKL